MAFSIFKYVFLWNDINEEKLEDILSHELVHIREKHSLDLLYFELLRILCWFNPLVYIYQKRISEVHEYIADAIVVQDKNKTDYYEKLLAEVFQTQQFSFTNQFFKHSLIKKRIIMLTKQKSRQILKLKYLVLVPLLIVSLVCTSWEGATFTDNDKDTVKNLDKEELMQESEVKYDFAPFLSKHTIDSDKVYLFADIDKLPIYPGCETLESQEKIKQCLTKNIQKHVAHNFNMKLAEKSGLVGKQKIEARFIIEKNGKVTVPEAKAPNAVLSKETKRVLKSLPTFIPGQKDGKPVRVSYVLPIAFQVQE
jgi:hypothetical protein